jgi:hypothetical protein
MEIIGNIAKQKEDIDKVLKDTKELQKEINNFTGQLDRSFTVADELIFQVKSLSVSLSLSSSSHPSFLPFYLQCGNKFIYKYESCNRLYVNSYV